MCDLTRCSEVETHLKHIVLCAKPYGNLVSSRCALRASTECKLVLVLANIHKQAVEQSEDSVLCEVSNTVDASRCLNASSLHLLCFSVA